ncbi:MAG: hypothetical protein HQ512_06980 [Rhodospirillales bacterium]|nr:hypothetical protein [Rhodospirillales bacterium]
MISEDYRAMNKAMHEARPEYGISGKKYAQLVQELLQSPPFNGQGCTVLDYGCGKSTLRTALTKLEGDIHTNDKTWQDYDPCIPGKDAAPKPADLVVCTDVLEHIEPEFLDAVLDDLKRLTKKSLFVLVATRPAKKTLADGRNAHLTIEPVKWWVPKLMERFDLVFFKQLGGEFFAIFTPPDAPPDPNA